MAKDKTDFFKSKPWNTIDEYFALCKQYNLYGDELAAFIKKEQKRVAIPLPSIKKVKKHES